MPIFQYKGYRSDGSAASGTIEADGVQNAIEGVKALGIYPKDVNEYVHRKRRWLPSRQDRTLLPHITRQLAVLLSSGVPLIDALRSLAEENGGLWKTLLVSVRERVSGGASLSRALADHRKIFPEFYISMVAAGEKSGTLDRILVRVADFLEKQEGVRAKIRMAMIYPLFMISVGFLVMVFLFTFVIPKIVKIFENTRSALPLATVVLIKVSNLFVYYWWAVIVVLAALVYWIRRLREHHGEWIDAMKLKAPGGVLQSLYFGRFARTLSFLLDGGLPMLKSLELAAKSAGNRVIEARILKAGERVAEGAGLSSSLEGFPSVLLQLIATGEKSGTLSVTLGKAADSYEEEFERKVQKSLALLEPGMILLMGLVVGFIVLAVLLPMFQMNQLIK
jgi:general secretion pathway protein F